MPGIAPPHVEAILGARHEKTVRSRRNWFVGWVLVIGAAAFLLPAMREPINVWRLNHSGIQRAAAVNDAYPLPNACRSGCWESPHVVITQSPGTYWVGTFRHHIPSAAKATPNGGSFPVWFLPNSYALLTARPPGSTLVAAAQRWSWILVLLLAGLVYEPLDRAWARRRKRS